MQCVRFVGWHHVSSVYKLAVSVCVCVIEGKRKREREKGRVAGLNH